ncbi:MAG TPA: putative Ig domain-containing protein [Gammaproteobacteria bacterium]|nr:putative Ig domain-containing protein [Gammaproteobacteria bacterium]
MKPLISRTLLSCLLFLSCMAIPAPLSLGQTNYTGGSTVDCNLTPNPDQCWRQKNQQTWTPSNIQNLPLSTDTWGLKGPLAASLKYDTDLDWILGLNYLHMFSDRLGLALKATYGPNEWRGNLTAGYRFKDKHQFKLTYEYLNQNLPYDFDTGTINSRVYQHSFGGAYQYLFQRGIVHSFELSGNYTKAPSTDLPGVIFYNGDDAYINLRRIAGGGEVTGLASVNLLPWETTSLALGAGYSQITYDTWFENNQNVSTVAYKAELSHVFHPTIKATASVNNTASSTEYNAKVSKLLPKNFEVSLGAQRQESRGNLQDANSLMLGVSYPAPKSYSMNKLGQGALAELKSWIDKPVVYYNRVLAVRDQAVKKYAIASQPIPSQTKAINQVIDNVDTKNYFQFDPRMFEKVDFSMVIAPVGSQTSSPDMSPALNIIITQKNAYEAVVSSAAPIPGGQSLEGKYNVTITATGTQPNLKNPVTEIRTFVLTVTYAGPSWTAKSLPAATINTNYPEPAIDLSKDSGTINGFVTTTDLPDDTYTFKILKSPSWVILQDQHLLVPNGVVQESDTKPVQIEIQVTSNTLKESATKTFDVQINAGAPVWSENLPDGQYGVIYPGANLNTYVKTPGETETQYTFRPDRTLPAWLQLNNETGALTGIKNIPDDASMDTQIYVTAIDKKTGLSSPGVLTIHLKPGAPIWIDNTLPDAQQGVEYEQVDLAPKLRTAGLPNGDTYKMALDANSPSWLQIIDGHFLTAKGKVPTDAPNTVKLTITAHSEITGLNASQPFIITVTKQGAPIWNQTDLPNGQYGAPYINFDLRKYVTTPGRSDDEYNFTLNDNSSLPSWLQFNNGVIDAAPNAVIPEGAPSVVEIGVTVKSTLTGLSTPATLVMKILPGIPVWTDNTLPDAQQGVPYEGVDLSPKLHTPGLPKDTYQMVLTGTNPSWLQITNGHFLSANGAVPTDAPPEVSVVVTATSENAPGNLKATQTFNLVITKPNAPIWTQTDLPNGQYNTHYGITDLRRYVTTPGNSKDQYEFRLASSSSPLPSWLELNNGVLQGKGDIPESAPNILELQVIVKSTITNAETQATLVINILPGNPIWTDNTLPDAQEGILYPDVDLSKKLHTPGLRGDTYQMTLSGNPTWLKIENGTFLTGAVPNNAPSSINFTVTATSQTNSELSSSEPFVLTITKPGAPIWINTALPNGRYNNVYSSSVDLNTYVSTPNKPNEQYTFTVDSGQPLPSWLKLADGHILTGTQQIIPESTPTVVKLHITVTNTERISTSGILIINVLPGAPIWSGNLPNAQYNVTYGHTDLLPLVRTPGAESDNYQFHLDQAPAWLTLDTDGHSLIGKSAVPENDASPVVVKITAISGSSQLSSQQTFSVTINSGAPVWTDNTLPDAQQGVDYVGADLSTKLHTPGLAKDTYTMKLETSVDWLQVTAEGHLQSTGPVPDNQTSPVTFTVTATSTNGLSATQSFSLTITQAGAPIWIRTNLPDGNYGMPYQGSVDLKTLVSTPNNPTDTYTFSPDQPLPAWLTLNSNGTLMGNQNVIPEDASTVVRLPITVTNLKGISTPSILIINVRPGAPIWSGSLADAQYNVTYGQVDLLPMVRTPGMAYDNYQFKLDQAPAWLALGSDGHSLIGQSPVPETDATPVTVKITATSTTSKLPTQQTFSLTIKSGAPVWTDNSLPDAQQGQTYTGADLTTKLHTPGLAKDTYTMQLNAPVSWLQVTTDGHLQSTGAVPDNQTSPVTFTVTATSTNGLSDTQSFSLTITQAGAPIWIDTNLSDGYYGAPYQGSVDLKTLVSTPNNPTDTYTFSPDQPLPSWLTLNSDGTLTGNQNAIPEDATTIVKLPITVTNLKGISTPNVLIINVRPGAPIWNGSLNDAQYNVTYGQVDLLPMVRTPGMASDNYQFNLDQAPAWLTLGSDGHSLVGQSPVPETDATPVTVKITAISATSKLPTQQTFSITIKSGAPVWTDDTLPDAQQGQTYIGTDLTTKLHTPGLAKDTYNMRLDAPVSWLQITDGHLQSVGAVPIDQTSPVTFTVTATSTGNSLSAPQTFSLTVTPVGSPMWDVTDLPDGNYDAVYADGKLINLIDYVSTPDNMNDEYTFAPAAGETLPSWLTLDPDGIIQGIGNIPESAPSIVRLKVTVTSTISGKSTTGTLQINIRPGAPIWSGDLPAAQYNAVYPKTSLLPLVRTPGLTSDTYQFTLDPSAPSWLTIDNGGNLVGQGTVPESDISPVTVKITASSTGAQLSTPQTFSVTINPGNPEWIDTTIPNAQQGQVYPAVDLALKLKTPGLPGDTYQINLDSNLPSWLTLDSDGHTLIGTGQVPDQPGTTVDVKVTATSQKTSGNLKSPQQSFTINILDGIGWSGLNPDQATAGESYSYVADNLISCPTNQVCSVLLSNLPDWLTAQPNPDGTTTLVSNQVPAAAQDPSGTVSFDVAASTKSGQTLPPKTFNIVINNIQPRWQNPTTPPTVNYDGTSDLHLIHLNTYIIEGATNLVITEGTGFDETKWKLVKEGTNDYYLQYLPGSVDDIGKEFSVPLIATNSTSQTPKNNAVEVVVGPNAALGAPEKQTEISAADMGYPYPTVDLNSVFKAPVAGDVLSFNFTASGGKPWLVIEPCTAGGKPSTCLAAKGDVPLSDDTDFTVTIHAQSKASGQSVDQEFTAPINQQHPIWTPNPSGVIQFNNIDASQTAGRIELNQFITDHTGNQNGSQQPPLLFKMHDATDPNWMITQDPTDKKYYLSMTAANPAYNNAALVGTEIVPAPVIDAYNNTSSQNAPVTKTIQVISGPDASLGVPTKQADIVDANMGYPYATVDLNSVFKAPIAGDTLSFSFTNGGGQQWLDIQPCTIGGNASTCLVAKGDVPLSDDPDFTVTIHAHSNASGQSIDQPFTAKLIQQHPEWTPTPTGTIQFNNIDANAPTARIELSQFIISNTGNQDGSVQPPLSFQLHDEKDPNWLVTRDPTDHKYYLTMTAANPAYNNVALIDTEIVPAPVIDAYNNTSSQNAPVTKTIQVTSGADTTLGPPTKETNIANANMGYPYPTVDLNTVFKAPIAGDILNFGFTTGGGQTWLDIQPCTIGGNASTCLVAKGDVPISDDKDFTVTIHAQSKASGQFIDQEFTTPIIQQHPFWTTNPSGIIQFNIADPTQAAGRIELNQFITDHTGNQDGSQQPPLFFKLHDESDPNWLVTQDPTDKKYYLSMTKANPAYNNVALLATGMPISPGPLVDAYNNTSSQNAPVTHAVQVILGPDASLGAPTKQANILDANMGYPYPTIDLNSIFKAPTAGDILKFKFTAGGGQTWLDIQPCTIGGNASTCLVAKGDVALSDDTDFTVTINAYSSASGQSIDQPFTANLIQQHPDWTPAPAGTIQFNSIDTTAPAARIELSQFITSNKGNQDGSVQPPLVFKLHDEKDTNWLVTYNSTDKKYYLTMTAANPAYNNVALVGTEILPAPVIDAYNNTSSQDVPMTKTIKVTSGTDSSKQPVWDPKATIPPAYLGYAYGDTNVSTGTVDLADPSRITTPGIANDTYTFDWDPSALPPDWLSFDKTQPSLLVSDGDVPTSATAFAVGVIATSKATGNTAKILFNVGVQPTLPKWQNVTQSTMYFDDLSTTVPTTATNLASWITTDSNKGIQFQIDTSDPTHCATNFKPANWKLATGTATILRTTNDLSDIYDGTNSSTIVRIPVLATNTTSPDGTGTEQCIPVQVQPRPGDKPTWNSKTLPPIYGTFTYPKPGSSTIDLGTYLNDNGNTAFTCKLNDNPATPSWMKITNNQQLSSNNTVVPPIDNRPSVSIQCQSQKTGQWTDTPSSGAGLFTVDVAPVLKSATDADIPTLTSIKFDQIDTGSGIKINDLLVSGRSGATITLSSGGGSNPNYIAANWGLATDNNVQYLRRKAVNTQIDAADLVSNEGKVSMKLQVTNNTSTLSDTATYPFTLLPDPDLKYTYTGTGLDTNLRALEPDSASSSTFQTWVLLDGTTVQGSVTDSKGTQYLVIHDGGFTYSNPGGQPSFIDFNPKTAPKINIGYPTYSDLGETNIAWNVNVSTMANGNKSVSMAMPAFSVDTVTLAPPVAPTPPYSGIVSGIMTMGTDHYSGGLSQNYWTYLWVQLKPNTKYKLLQAAYTATAGAGITNQICNGKQTQTKNANVCGDYSAVLGHLKPGGDEFTTDSTGIVTLIVGSINNDGSQNRYPKFETDASNPFSTEQNVVLQLK